MCVFIQRPAFARKRVNRWVESAGSPFSLCGGLFSSVVPVLSGALWCVCVFTDRRQSSDFLFESESILPHSCSWPCFWNVIWMLQLLEFWGLFVPQSCCLVPVLHVGRRGGGACRNESRSSNKPKSFLCLFK